MWLTIDVNHIDLARYDAACEGALGIDRIHTKIIVRDLEGYRSNRRTRVIRRVLELDRLQGKAVIREGIDAFEDQRLRSTVYQVNSNVSDRLGRVVNQLILTSLIVTRDRNGRC